MTSPKWKPPRYGYTDVFEEDGWFLVNRQDEYVGDSYTVVSTRSKESADAVKRLLDLLDLGERT